MGEWDNYCDEIGGICKDMEAQAVRIAELEDTVRPDRGAGKGIGTNEDSRAWLL